MNRRKRKVEEREKLKKEKEYEIDVATEYRHSLSFTSLCLGQMLLPTLLFFPGASNEALALATSSSCTSAIHKMLL